MEKTTAGQRHLMTEADQGRYLGFPSFNVSDAPEAAMKERYRYRSPAAAAEKTDSVHGQWTKPSAPGSVPGMRGGVERNANVRHLCLFPRRRFQLHTQFLLGAGHRSRRGDSSYSKHDLVIESV